MRTCNRVVWSVFFALLANVASGLGAVPAPGAPQVSHDVCALQFGAGEAGAGDLSALQGLMGIASGEAPPSGELRAGPIHQATLDMERTRVPRQEKRAIPVPARALLTGADLAPARSALPIRSLAPPCAPRALLPLGPHAPPFLA